MALKTATAGVESEWKELEREEAKLGTAVFFRTRRVTDQPAKGANHPTGYAVDCEVWLLDGPNAGHYVESAYVFPAGMLNKMDTTPGGHSAGRLELYKNVNGNWSVGLTEMTAAQLALAQAKDEELSKGGASAPASAGGGGASSDGSKYDDEPPF